MNMTKDVKSRGWATFFDSLFECCLYQLEWMTDETNKLTDGKEPFQLAIVPIFDYCPFLINQRMGIKKFIFVNEGTYLLDHVAIQTGVPLLPSFIPGPISLYSDTMDFWQRMDNFHFSFTFSTVFLYLGDSILTREWRIFAANNDGADLYTYVRRSTLAVMINGEPILNFPRPLPYNAFYLSELGITRPSEPPFLDRFFLDLIGNSSLIIVSFGTIANSEAIPEQWMIALLDGLGRLTGYTVIWSFKGRPPKKVDEYSHIHMVSWMPQRELLFQPTTRLFVTHTGYNSLLESTRAGVPLLMIPLFVDQQSNAFRAIRLGLGLSIDKTHLTVELLHSTALKLLKDDRFKQRTLTLAGMFADKIITSEMALSYRMKLTANLSTEQSVFLAPMAKCLTTLQLLCLDVLLSFCWLAIAVCFFT